MTLGLAVLFRGYDVTLQCVEAVAGPDGDEVDPETGRVVTPAGWVEMRLMDSDGHVRFHPPSEEHAAHVVTVVREGRVQIVRGTDVINGPHPLGDVTIDPHGPVTWLPMTDEFRKDMGIG
jgi:hypothetical protein